MESRIICQPGTAAIISEDASLLSAGIEEEDTSTDELQQEDQIDETDKCKLLDSVTANNAYQWNLSSSLWSILVMQVLTSEAWKPLMFSR